MVRVSDNDGVCQRQRGCVIATTIIFVVETTTIVGSVDKILRGRWVIERSKTAITASQRGESGFWWSASGDRRFARLGASSEVFQ